MKARHAIGLALTIFLCGAIRVIAGQQATFKGAVRTVAIYATALRDTTLVSDLQRDDFRVDDNGKLQELTQFANDIQPITVVLLLDRSGSMRANFELVEKAAETFVQDLGPRDKARIGSFSNRIQLDPREFTGDHDILLGILRQELQEEGPTPLWNAVNVGITALLHEEGRRVILVFTDGVDEPMNPGANSNTLSGVMHRADEENVMVYAIGLSGMNGRPGMPPGMGRGGIGALRRHGAPRAATCQRAGSRAQEDFARDRRRLFRTDQRRGAGRHLQAGDRRTAPPVSPRFFADGSRWQAPQAHRDRQGSRRHRARASILRRGPGTVRRTASPCLALLLLALAGLPRVAAAQSAPALRVDARSRSVAPGELVILTMAGDSAGDRQRSRHGIQ